MSRIVRMLPGLRPLHISRERVLLAAGCNLFTCSPDGRDKPELLVRLPGRVLDRLDRSRLARRLLRLDPHAAIAVENGWLVATRQGIFRCERDGGVTLERRCVGPTRPLRFAQIRAVPGFSDSIAYGDYGANMERRPMSIRVRRDLEWRTAFAFPEGAIEHVHGLVPDPQRRCVWILTGDFEGCAGIWRATRDFSDVQPVLRATQDARACVAFARPEGLLYATDSQLETNSIRLLECRDGVYTSRAVHRVNGPVIYGAAVGGSFVFTTAVEPGAPTGNFVFDLFDPRVGSGILSRRCEVVVGGDDLGFRTAVSWPSDLWPKRLLQFSAFVCAEHATTAEYFAFHAVAVRGRHDTGYIVEL